MPIVHHFLMVYDHARGRLLSQESFPDSATAVAAYAEAEKRYRKEGSIEIVLVGADSIDTIKQTHGHYFQPAETSRYLAEVI
jgi:hypothetical protein